MALSEWMGMVRERVDRRLGSFLDEKSREAREISPAGDELVHAIAALTMRGGKRLRAVVLSAGFNAVAPGEDLARTDDAGACIELLQSYLLIHDDWMDQDDERRGGPSVHAALGKVHGRHLGACLAILAGDLAGAYAWELHLAAPFPAARRADADRLFLLMQKEVYFGQQLDVTASPDVSRMHQLKTGSYTVRGPLLMGAVLGAATDEQIDALTRFAEPIGEAFQLRDDILGTFGDASATGKPAGNDLRAGKRTALVAEVERLLRDSERAPLSRVLGNPEASDVEVAEAAELIVQSGARKNVELRLEELVVASDVALEGAPLDPGGVALLREIASKLAKRST